MITRTRSAPKVAPKSDFLTTAQRKDLHSKLLDKFTKLYGLSCPGQVKAEVDRFFASGAKINSKTLAELEKKIRAESLKYKSNAPSKANAPVCQNTAQATVEDLKQTKEKTSTEEDFSAPAKAKATEDDEEEPEVDEIAFYKNYIAKQEKEIEAKRKQLQQKSVKSQLDQQLSRKEQVKSQIKKMEEGYAECEKQQIMMANQRAEEIAQKAREDKNKLLEMQKKILEERTKQINQEKEKEKEVQNKITACLREDLSKAKADAFKKAEEQRKTAAKMMSDNEERKKRKNELEAQQRKEEMELQNTADRIAKEQEERRNAEVKARSDKINNMIKAGENTVNRMRDRKDEEEARLMKYWKRKNEQTDKKEEIIKNREKENKVLYKQFLDMQMIEKQEKVAAEKELVKQQADLWAKDIELFKESRTNKTLVLHQDLKAYKEKLDEQVKEKQMKMQVSNNKEDVKDALLRQIADLESTKQSIEAQLSCF